MSIPFLVPDDRVYDISFGDFLPGVTDFTLPNLYGAIRFGRIRDRSSGSIKVLVDLRIHDSLHIQNALDFYDGGKLIFAHYFQILLRPEYDDRDPKSYTLITGPCGKQVCLITREMP